MCNIKLKPLLGLNHHIHVHRCAVFMFINLCHQKNKNHSMYFNSSLNIFGPHCLLLPCKAVVVKRAIWSFWPNYIQDKVVYAGAASYVPSDTPL